MRKLNRLLEKMHSLKQRFGMQQREYEERNQELKREKESVLLHFQRLKAQMASSRGRERERLTQLTLKTDETMQRLQVILWCSVVPPPLEGMGPCVDSRPHTAICNHVLGS